MNAVLYATGLVLGAANTVRHRRQGYVNPRPFDPADVDRTLDHAFEVVATWQNAGATSFAGKRVLEIGPGSDMTTGAIMLARGAASYRAVDLFDNRNQAAPGLYRRLEERLGVPVDDDALAFTRTEFPDLPDLDGTYDVVVSNACLEHVADPARLLTRLARAAAPGTVMAHLVDAKAHMRWFRDHDPLNHLRYPTAVYDHLLEFPGAPNRWLAEDYVAAAAAAGWDARIVPAETADPGYLRGICLARPFRSRSDLSNLVFLLACRRRSARPDR
jgi:SAM-dependent methyltransferase